MAEILDTVRDAVEGQIDFVGQNLADQISTNVLVAVGILAVLLGYITQNIYYTLWATLAGTALVFLLVVPPWPWYNRNPVKWLPPRGRPVSLAGTWQSPGVEGLVVQAS